MSQKIYLDDCAYAKELVRLLEAAGHQVTVPRAAGTTGRVDEIHFRYAAGNGLILITKNPDDFLDVGVGSYDKPVRDRGEHQGENRPDDDAGR